MKMFRAKINIKDDNTKMQFMNMQRTPKSNIYEQQLNNPISGNIYGKRIN